MKKSVSLCVTLILSFCLAFPGSASALTSKPRVEAQAAIVIDMTTKEVLYEKNIDQRLYPASTTKMITCILALERLDLNTVLTIDEFTAKTGGSSIYLKAGEEIKVIDLLYAMMLESSNDASVALAIAISGNVDEFALLMNEKAKEYGALHTNFVNPNGLHNNEHLSTAYDLAMIASRCMENEMFRTLVNTSTYTIAPTNKSASRRFVNTNRLLWDDQKGTSIYVKGVLRACKYEYAIGVKTGYTSNALACLVSAAQKDGTTLVSVVLRSTDLGRYADSISLLDWGFENYKTIKLFDKSQNVGKARIKQGTVSKVDAVLAETVAFTVPIEASEAVLTTELRFNDTNRAPIEKDQILGELILFESGNQVASFPVVAAEAVIKGGALSRFGVADATVQFWGKVFIVALAGLFGLVNIYIINERRKVKKRKMERAERLRKKKASDEAHRSEWDRQYENRYRNFSE